ncbi:MAG: ABC transporter ATP-binding protein [Lachnospiraceae bacterium]
MLKLVKRNIRQYSGPMLIAIVTLFLQTITDLYLPTLNADITNNGMAKGDIEYIIRTGSVMLLIVGVGVVCMIVSSYFSSAAAMGLGKNIREELFCHVETLSKGDIDEIGTASLITRATNDVMQVQNAAMMMLRMMLMAPIMCIGGIIMARRKSPDLSWVIICALPFIAALLIYMLYRGLPLFKSIQKKIDRVNQVIREYLSGIRVIRAFCKDDYEKKRFQEANTDLMQVSLKVFRMMSFMMPAMMLIVNATNIAIVWVGGKYMVAGKLQVGDLTAFITYVALILMSIMMMSMLFIMLPRASASADRINEVLNKKPAVSDKEQVQVQHGNTRGSLVFENVTFSYPGAESPVLTNISFETRPGEVTAIIGGTGSGKSTLINLIPRFYDVTSGSVKIDGVDVRSFGQEELRKKIGLVPQRAFLFSGTIEENVKMGREDATEEEVLRALEIAQAAEFVNEKEEKEQTIVTQGGTNVSGGQRQRLAIARAIVRRPEIYIFDDSFSALDYKTDAALRKALYKVIEDSTVLIIAHRVSTIMNADRILVLDDGELVGIGTHKELLESCKVYQEIVYSQHNESEAG